MKVFVIPSYYPSKEKPEDSIFVKEQVEALKKYGVDVFVVSVQIDYLRNLKRHNKSPFVEIQNDIPVEYLYMKALVPMKYRRVIAHAFSKKLEKAYLDAVERFGTPDVIYAHFSFPAGVAATKLSSKYNIPLVIEEHFSGLMKSRIDNDLLNVLKSAIDGADTFICVSDGLKRAIQRHVGYKENVMVVSNMIDPCFRFHERIRKQKFVFFTLGNLVPRKGMDILIKAFYKAFGEDSDVVLRIAGSGQEYERLESLIKELGLINSVTLIGHLNREQTLTEYINCDSFALASKAETYGLVYREAMAVGRPIISTKHGGFTDNDWNDAFGFLVEVDDVDRISEAMKEVYYKYEEFDLRQISTLCLSTCSDETVISQICSILSNASDRR